MIVVLLENKVYCIDSLIKKVKSNFPGSSILEVNRSNRFEMLKMVKTKPLLTNKWVIICDARLNVLQCEEFFKRDEDLVILNVTSSTKSEVINTLESLNLPYSLVDNVNVSKKTLVDYVSLELSLSEKDATTLCNKCNHYLPYVLESVSLLKTLGRDVNKNDILKFIDKKTTVNLTSLLFHLMGYRVLDSSVVSSYLYDFRYAFDYIKSNLVAYIEDCIYVYSLIESGFLGADNVKDYQFDRKLKISDYVLKTIVMDIHKKVSFEFLLLLKIKITKCTGMYMLLNIV